MDHGLATVIGMSLAYAASFVGLVFAWVGWKERRGDGEGRHGGGGDRGGAADPGPSAGREGTP